MAIEKLITAEYRKAMIRGGAVFAIAAALAGCAVFNPGDTRNLKQHGSMNEPNIRTKAESDANRLNGRRTLSFHTIHNTPYVALSDAATAMGYHGEWLDKGKTFAIGDHDPIWTWKTGQSQVIRAGRTHRIPAPAVREGGRLWIPASALERVFGQEVSFSASSAGMTVIPHPVLHAASAAGGAFADAPAGSAGASGAKAADLLAYGKRYLGVPYQFGAPKYETGKTFDCSSFVERVMGHVGIDMPRSAGEQSGEGDAVSRDELLPGDLLFFNVPGRFKSQTAVGHVGIYMGGGKMLHASPAGGRGVQITNINQPYYQRTFLFAKRVI
ncbi:C40 family peptidase [Cohnella caldifontis]|uniref:C40 family peptidase n=1 Tax=Cohnella caldifontis TaxID=3027471 RepID=UPI0023EDE47A|nr:C40 family peptidase [Cohnella sp. YIM B05605]